MSAAANAPSSSASAISIASTFAFFSAAIAVALIFLPSLDRQVGAGDLISFFGAQADEAVADRPVASSPSFRCSRSTV